MTFCPGAGGAIANFGLLTMRRCTAVNNRAVAGSGGAGASGYGGAILNEGRLDIFQCTFESNFVSGEHGYGRFRPTTGGPGLGGAIWNVGVCNASSSSFIHNIAQGIDGILGSIFGGNSGAMAGGGAIANSGFFSGTNITLGNNIAAGGNAYDTAVKGGDAWGGALFNLSGTTVLSQVSIVANGAVGGRNRNPGNPGIGYGGSIAVSNGLVLLNGTILANSLGTSNCFGIVVDGGHNLSSDNSPNFTTPTSRNNLDPLLGPLVNNGGLTLTLSPLPGSPAIDTGNDSTAPATDQRGVPRPQGAHSDIGAVEATFLNIVKLANGNFRLRYAGIPGESYTLEGKPAFSELWSGIETKPAGPGGALQYSDLPGTAAQGVFRVKSE
jgi:hypothetical protein